MAGPLKNTRHEAFAQALAKGSTVDAAYTEAGYKPNRKNASRLKTNEGIQKRVADLQACIAGETIKAAALTDADFIARLIREADHYGEGSSHGARVQAIKLIGDYLGLLKQRIEHGTTDRFILALREISRRGSAAPIATARDDV
jgi:hypothetical protein